MNKKIMLSMLMVILMIVSVSAVSAATLFEDDFNDQNLMNGGWERDYFESPYSFNLNEDAQARSDGYNYDGAYTRLKDDIGIAHYVDTTG